MGTFGLFLFFLIAGIIAILVATSRYARSEKNKPNGETTPTTTENNSSAVNNPTSSINELNGISDLIAQGDGLGAESKYLAFVKSHGTFDAVMEKSLGDCFHGKKDFSKAFEWYHTSAEHGFASAQNSLGQAYQFGRGVERNIIEAVKWYRMAGDQNNAAALFNLGYIYDFADGVPQNYVEAAYWYQKAADLGLKEAQANLAYLYEQGLGVKQDYNLAAKYYMVAADQGSLMAQNQLGMLYHYGLGVKKDDAVATKWWLKAANGGYAPSQATMGTLYYYSQDYDNALGFFTASAKQGNPTAQFYMGLMYEKGTGVKQDLAVAVKWYRMAAQQGNVDAKKKLTELSI